MFINSFLFSQKISSNVLKYYEFNFCDSPQSLILIKKNNHKYSGYIQTTLKKGGNNKLVIKKSRISSVQSTKIISELEEKGIDMVNQNYDDGLNSYLDGDVLTIKLLRNNNITVFSFDELYPESESKVEETPLRRKIQIWLSIVDAELNLKEKLLMTKEKLRKGIYCYSSGVS
jgi:hypothetical protein